MSRKAHPVDRTRVKQRVRLKRQSQKMALLENQRRMLRRQWFEAAAAKTEVGYALCEAGLQVCSGIAHDAHEIVSRARGGSILLRKNVRLICRSCHQWIHTHPAEATMLGLLDHAGQPQEDDQP